MGLPFDWHRPTRLYGPDSDLVRDISSARLIPLGNRLDAAVADALGT
jgi:hypothetical protein